MIGVIYKYTSPSGKHYIGQTIDEQKRRADFLNENQAYAGDKINKAREKYGAINFSYEILAKFSAESIEEVCDLLDFAEQYYIEKFDSFHSGYNLTEGGATFRKWKKTQDQIRKQRESIKKYYETHKNPNSKKVLQYDLNGVFIKEWNSATEAETALGYSSGNISNVCKGKGKSAMGYMWRYKEGDSIPETIEKCKVKGTPHKHAGLLQLDLEGNLIKEWNSNKEASEALGIKSASAISEVCRGRRKSVKGFVWRYKEQVKLLAENKYEL